MASQMTVEKELERSTVGKCIQAKSVSSGFGSTNAAFTI